MAPSNLHKFDHLVVLMMENRGFDHLMGLLYTDDEPERFIPDHDRRFRGALAAAQPWNEDDSRPPRRSPIAPAPWETLEDMLRPFPDPGEEHAPHVLRQIFGADVELDDPDAWPEVPPMSGFVRDYLKVARERADDVRPGVPDATLADEIMRSFPPQATPVLSGLARAFAVSDAWFSSVPSQTYCNRSFLHAASSSGFVNNANYMKWSQNEATTIFERLAERLPAGKDSRVYWDPQDLVPLTRLLHRPLYDDRWDAHFRDIAELSDACAAGDLPAYTFIQPRILLNNNDYHPAYYASQLDHSSILAGEELIADVYNALRAGPRWERTLFVILFDEHGGTYDHVPPPRAAPPEDNGREREEGFRFDRLGVRVPAVFISPFIEPGTVVRSSTAVPFDHTSIIRTLCARFDLEPFTARDRAAPDLGPVLTRPLEAPRLETPTFIPRPSPRATLESARARPLSTLQRALCTHFASRRGLPIHFATVGDALDLFLR